MQRIRETPKRFHCSRSAGCDIYPGGDFDRNLQKFSRPHYLSLLLHRIYGGQSQVLRMNCFAGNVATPVSLAQKERLLKKILFGFAWEREIEDTEPLPGIIIRRVYYRLKWNEAGSEYSYDAELYVKPTDPR